VDQWHMAAEGVNTPQCTQLSMIICIGRIKI